MDVVSRQGGRQPLPSRRYVVADRNGSDPDNSVARGEYDKTRQCNVAILRRGCSDRRRTGKASRRRCGGEIDHPATVAIDVADDLWRQGTLPETVLERIQGTLPDGRRGAPRQGWILLDRGTNRRCPERGRASTRHLRDRERISEPRGCRRGGGGRPAG